MYMPALFAAIRRGVNDSINYVDDAVASRIAAGNIRPIPIYTRVRTHDVYAGTEENATLDILV